MEFLTQPIRRSTMIEEVGESLVPEGSLADGFERRRADLRCVRSGGNWRRRANLQRGSSGSSKKGQLASDVGAVDGEDESPCSWLE
ncbi:hypothetical protein ACQJBY_016873 [Aegilops geniculata]